MIPTVNISYYKEYVIIIFCTQFKNVFHLSPNIKSFSLDFTIKMVHFQFILTRKKQNRAKTEINCYEMSIETILKFVFAHLNEATEKKGSTFSQLK